MTNPSLERVLFSAGLTAASRLLLLKRYRLCPAELAPAPTTALILQGGRRISAAYLVHPHPGTGRPSLSWHRRNRIHLACSSDTPLPARHLAACLRLFGIRPAAPFSRGCGRRSYIPSSASSCGITHLLSGLSLGTGVALSLAQDAAPHRLILCAPYTSCREAVAQAARQAFLPAAAAQLFPDIWDNREAIARLRMPVLLVHGEADRLFPIEMSETLLAACPNARLIRVPGCRTTANFTLRDGDYWQPIADFLKDP